MKKSKRKLWMRLAKLSVVVFALYAAMLLINNQISLNQARARTVLMEKRNSQQRLVNAGIEERNKILSDSEKKKQYIIDVAHNKLFWLKHNELLYIDVSH